MQAIDTLINARWVIPVEPEGALLEDHSVAVHEGRILAVVPTAVARRIYAPAVSHDLPQHALIPGLVNAHTHAAMSFTRGLADDLPLMTWLNEHIWPTEARWVGMEFVREGTQLAIAEMLRGGITTFNDMYFFPEETARTAVSAGMRAVIGLIVIEFPTAWAQDAQEYLHKGLAVHDEFRNEPLITTAFAPHAPYTVADSTLERVRMYAEELELPIHMHVHETAEEVAQGEREHGVRPLARLERLGLVSPALAAVHMTQLTPAEIDLLAANGAHVVHCPESNLKLASGFCPVHRLLEAGVNVALGTDGAASNNDLDLFGEMRTAALLAKGVSGNASAVPAAQALRMATLNGARALGLEHLIGSLLPGKAADITAVYLGDIEGHPAYNPHSHLVYAVGREKVSDVWVAGRHVVNNRRLTTLDEEAVIAQAREWQSRIAAGRRQE